MNLSKLRPASPGSLTHISSALSDLSPEQGRFLSAADCQEIEQRLMRAIAGGGEVGVQVVSRWRGYVRWARNRIVATGEDRDNRIVLSRSLRGAREINRVVINETTDAALIAAVRRAERLLGEDRESFEADVEFRADSPFRYTNEVATEPQLFYQPTYDLAPPERAKIALELTQHSSRAGLLAAGYIEVTATSIAFLTSWGNTRYYQYTWAQCSMTVRAPKGIGSGWAGVDWPDWTKINGEQLSEIALDKCLKSRNPVAVEPGRYTTILEPQAVSDFLRPWATLETRFSAENDPGLWFHRSVNFSRIGEKVIDERLTLSSNLLSPELGFAPYSKLHYFEDTGEVYHPITWIERGVLQALPYDRRYGIEKLGKDAGLPASGALEMSVVGSTATIEEMIAATKRGLLVTRFDSVTSLDDEALLISGYTRDGLWLIEYGKITKPIKNLRFVESISFALNNVDQVGAPQRCFNPLRGWVEEWALNPAPMVMPALKIRDFSFPALVSAI